MSIFSDEFNKANLPAWKQSKLDLPVPDKMDSSDIIEWQRYIENLSPGLLVKKFSEAVDHVLYNFENPDNSRIFRYDDLTAEDKTLRHAKLLALHILSQEIETKFSFPQEPSNHFRSEMETAVENMVHFFELSGAGNLNAWLERQVTFKKVLPNIEAFYDGFNAENAAPKDSPAHISHLKKKPGANPA